MDRDDRAPCGQGRKDILDLPHYLQPGGSEQLREFMSPNRHADPSCRSRFPATAATEGSHDERPRSGDLKKGETIRQCGIRECQEETGVEIEITGLVGVFTTPEHVIQYRKGKKTTEAVVPSARN
ncbi:NUDIX hydrolase [Actinomadura sp. HBU206391]|uniref:NUDIX hydrolase n=1 Tax=Actinomadura sp. HBU206391 TaxID=2731692 RepID=UPI0021C6327B|nr:NUDIX domain-containing protein [Actinomadura sp. HBU206391]